MLGRRLEGYVYRAGPGPAVRTAAGSRDRLDAARARRSSRCSSPTRGCRRRALQRQRDRIPSPGCRASLVDLNFPRARRARGAVGRRRAGSARRALPAALGRRDRALRRLRRAAGRAPVEPRRALAQRDAGGRRRDRRSSSRCAPTAPSRRRTRAAIGSRIALAAVLVVLASPLIAAELGFFLDGVPLLGWLFQTGRLTSQLPQRAAPRRPPRRRTTAAGDDARR